MPGSYAWLTLTNALSELSQRLNDQLNEFWSTSELTVYIQQSLRMFNCLTWTWKKNYNFNSTVLWNSLATLPNSPRIRSITDIYCYQQMQYQLLEPASGGIWTGTNQFNINQLSQALQTRRDEMLQVGNLNQSMVPNIALTPNIRTTSLPDTVIDVQRVRYLALQTQTTATGLTGDLTVPVGSTSGIAVGQLVTGTGIVYPSIVKNIGTGTITLSQPLSANLSGVVEFFTPNTLYRDDTVATEFYESPLYQIPSGTPSTFSLSSEPPLSWIVDIPPNQPGVYEAIELQTGTDFSPPASTLINVPDDFSPFLIYGALADILGQEPEATDRERASYCRKRYMDGLKLLQKIPWIMLGSINGVAVSCDSIFDMDRYTAEWDSSPDTFGPVIVTAGVDTFAAPTGTNVGITCLGNAPIPSVGGDFIQVSRSDWPTILDFAQSMADFKQGGAEFAEALELEKRAIVACAAENSRIRSFGCFSDIFAQRGQAQDRSIERYKQNKQGMQQ